MRDGVPRMWKTQLNTEMQSDLFSAKSKTRSDETSGFLLSSHKNKNTKKSKNKKYKWKIEVKRKYTNSRTQWKRHAKGRQWAICERNASRGGAKGLWTCTQQQKSCAFLQSTITKWAASIFIKPIAPNAYPIYNIYLYMYVCIACMETLYYFLWFIVFSVFLYFAIFHIFLSSL